MTLFSVPWLELSIVVPLAGAPVAGALRSRTAAGRWCLAFTTIAFGCAFLAWLGFYLAYPPVWGLVWPLTGDPLFHVDELSAPLIPTVALLHLLVVLSTPLTKSPRVTFGWILAGEAVRLAAFATTQPWLLIALLAASSIPAYAELEQRIRPTRVYAVHMFFFVALLAVGWAIVETGNPVLGSVLVLAGVLIRSGVVPAHLWVADLFEHATFSTALLSVTPIAGVYAAVRLALPIAPDWVLEGISAASLITAVYAAGMALVQHEARRFFAYLFLSHASLILVGLELVGSEEVAPISLTGALCLWFSVMLSLGGLGIILRAIEGRFGRLSLDSYHGLYEHSPGLAVGFLLTGLASVGFPGTLGFVSTELLVDGAVEANLSIGLGVVLAAAFNGIAVVRAYFLIFTGTRHVSSVSLSVTQRERLAMLVLTILILGGGLFPQPGVSSRYRAAERVLLQRQPDPTATTGHPVRH